MRKLPGFQPGPAGLERVVLRKLPVVLLAGTVLPLLFIVLAPIDPSHAAAFDYAIVGLVLTEWLLVITTAIGCLIVILMKGHAWVADAYELSDSNHPRVAGNDSRDGPERGDDRDA